MDSVSKAKLYRDLCDLVCLWRPTMTMSNEQIALSIGCTEATLDKILAKQTKGLKLSYEQVVSLMKLMGCSADTLFDAPSKVEQTVISVIEDLYQAFEQQGMDPSIENVVNGLCEYFGLTKAQVHEQLFALMQDNHLLVENGLFYVPDGQE